MARNTEMLLCKYPYTGTTNKRVESNNSHYFASRRCLTRIQILDEIEPLALRRKSFRCRNKADYPTRDGLSTKCE